MYLPHFALRECATLGPCGSVWLLGCGLVAVKRGHTEPSNHPTATAMELLACIFNREERPDSPACARSPYVVRTLLSYVGSLHWAFVVSTEHILFVEGTHTGAVPDRFFMEHLGKDVLLSSPGHYRRLTRTMNHDLKQPPFRERILGVEFE